MKVDAFQDLDKTLSAIDFYTEYQRLKTLVRANDPTLMQRLRSLGIDVKLSRGQDAASLLNKYVCHEDVLHMPAAELSSNLHLIETVVAVTSRTSLGLLVLMPANPLRK